MDISKSGIELNIKKSKDFYLYDNITSSYFLDLMSMYSSLPVGYNPKIFKNKNFKKEILEYSSVKVTNCEYQTKERKKFENKFIDFAGLGKYDFVHFASTGAIAVEMAIKAAIDSSNKKDGIVVYFKKSFHGVLGYSNFITDRVGPVEQRLTGFINIDEWIGIDNLIELEELIKNNTNISCLIIEPIRCTQGDLYYGKNELKSIFELCKKNKIITISDEIQTGFGSTGDVWYTNTMADIIVFGKKSQVSGFLTTSELGNKLNPLRYCVTWDGDVIDMIRCKHIIDYIKEKNLLDKVKNNGYYFIKKLKSIDGISNVRGEGFIIAFDLDNEKIRNNFYNNCLKNKILVNLTGEKSIRLRPSLNFSKKYINESIEKIKFSLKG